MHWSTMGDGNGTDGMLIRMGAGARKSPTYSRLMHDDAYVSKSCMLTLVMFRL